MFEVDWSKAPKGALWWAIDENGEAHWYCRPVADNRARCRFWYADTPNAPTFGYEGDWKDSLRDNPDAKIN